MRFKKSVLTGVIALSVMAGAGSAYAAPSTVEGNNTTFTFQNFGISMNDLFKSFQGMDTTEMFFNNPNTSVDYSNGDKLDSSRDQGTKTPGTNAGVITGSSDNSQNANNSSTSAYASQVVTLVNKERAKAGLSTLASDPALANMALDKAKDMYNNKYFDHNSPTYGSPFDMMKAYGIRYTYAGENIAKGQRNPQEVMNAWMNSTGHRQNILSPNFTKIGVAYYNGEWVQEFIAN
ncbi:CAP domain-containing protein [Paenibacillus turicensis]|uniref:CAP domain-containing protein n=1 Tax=Paenibacillus turicensis TaxID=160487 RepID=UPI003D26B7DA